MSFLEEENVGRTISLVTAPDQFNILSVSCRDFVYIDLFICARPAHTNLFPIFYPYTITSIFPSHYMLYINLILRYFGNLFVVLFIPAMVGPPIFSTES